MTTNVPPPSNTPSWAGDPKALAEAKNWPNEQKLREAETVADIWWAKAYGGVAVLFLIAFSLLFLGSLGSWAAHYILPANWHWLNPEQLSKIQSVLFSGSIGGVVSIMVQRQFSK